MKVLGNLSFGSVKRPKRVNDVICDCKEVERKRSVFVIYAYFKDNAFKQLKAMQNSQLGM